jgi:hypothetical protein
MSNRHKLRYLASRQHILRVAAMSQESRKTTQRLYHQYHRDMVVAEREQRKMGGL